MKRVTGIGGIFFKANDPEKLRNWYRLHLGIECENETARYSNGEKRTIQTPSDTPSGLRFRQNTDYFAPSTKPFMINLQVENLDEVLAQLKREGVDVDPKVESYDYGKFGWIMDPEGNRVELWEPNEAS